MSKRMVDLKVENGKVASIDGYEVVGGSGGSTIRTTYTQDSFTWEKNNSEQTFQVGDILRTFVKPMDENELPLQLKTTAVINLGTAKFISVPVQWNIGSNERAQAVELVCMVAGTIPANYYQNFIAVNRVRVVSE